MAYAEYRAQAEGESVEFEPEYEYPGQWFDDMGTLMMMTSDTGAAGYDLARAPITRKDKRVLSRTLMDSGIPGYE